MLTRKEFNKAFGFSDDLFGSIYGFNVERTTKRLHKRWAVSEEVAQCIAELKHEAVQYYQTRAVLQEFTFQSWFADKYALLIERGDKHELEVTTQWLKTEADQVVQQRQEQWRKRNDPTAHDTLQATLDALENDPALLEKMRRLWQSFSAESAEKKEERPARAREERDFLDI